MSSSADPIDEEDCGYLLTEYKFKVNNYLYGNEGDNIITVRSQVGNIFELGKEYTLFRVQLYFGVLHLIVYYNLYHYMFQKIVYS